MSRNNKKAKVANETVAGNSQTTNAPISPVATDKPGIQKVQEKPVARANFVSANRGNTNERAPYSEKEREAFKKRREEREEAEKNKKIENLISIVDNNKGLFARIEALIESDKKTPNVAVYIGSSKSKPMRNPNGKAIFDSKTNSPLLEHAVSVATLKTTIGKALVEWAVEIESISLEIAEIAEFIPGITKGSQFSKAKKENQEQVQALFKDAQKTLGEAGKLIQDINKLGYGIQKGDAPKQAPAPTQAPKKREAANPVAVTVPAEKSFSKEEAIVILNDLEAEHAIEAEVVAPSEEKVARVKKTA